MATFSNPSREKLHRRTHGGSGRTIRNVFISDYRQRRKVTEIKCMITSEPKDGTRVVLKQTLGKGTYFMGDGDVHFLCGNCNFILAKNVSEEQIQHQFHTPDELGLVLQCPRCKEFNELCSL